MDFLNTIDYNVVEVRGFCTGDTFRQVTDSFTAAVTIIGFDSDEIPIVEYKNIKYNKDIDWNNTKYGEGDAFTEGDIMPLVTPTKWWELEKIESNIDFG